MKKIIISTLLIFLTLPCFSKQLENSSEQLENTKPIECEITFDWISKTQLQRNANIKEIQSLLFSDKTVMKYKKKEFREKYSNFWKNKNYLKDYEDITNGKKEDSEKYYCGFYVGKLLVAYGIQYKNNMKNIYYYDAMGNLRWIDIFSDDYPNFPYQSYQYYRNGEMAAAYYYISDYDQYVFDPNKKFKGRWYNEKMYNRNAKVIMTRTNY